MATSARRWPANWVCIFAVDKLESAFIFYSSKLPEPPWPVRGEAGPANVLRVFFCSLGTRG